MTMMNWPWKPDPDYTRLLRTLRRQGDPHHVPFLELGFDPEVVGAVLDEPALGGHFTNQRGGGTMDRTGLEKVLDQRLRFWFRLGYDTCNVGPILDLPDLFLLASEDSADLRRDRRGWVDEKAGIITNWAEFERYAWPRADDADFYPLEYAARQLPEGMALIAGVRGVLEPAMWLMGYETFALALYDQPDLVQAVFDKIEEIVVPVARASAQMDHVVALWMGDDMGFKTGTMIAPDHLRQYVFPIQNKVASITHEHGLLFLLHACGNLRAVMEDLIDDVGVDAQHSFEDAIQPVESFTARYSDRIAVIGGLDVDLMARGTEDQVRTRVRHIMEMCAPSRAYVLGSGNTIANYIPPANFLAMLDEGWRFNRGKT